MTRRRPLLHGWPKGITSQRRKMFLDDGITSQRRKMFLDDASGLVEGTEEPPNKAIKLCLIRHMPYALKGTP